MEKMEVPEDIVAKSGNYAVEREYSRAVPRLDKGFEWRTIGGYLLATPILHPPAGKRRYSVTTFTLVRRILVKKREHFVRTFCQCSKKREQLVLAQMQAHTGLIVMGHVLFIPTPDMPIKSILEVTGMSMFRSPDKSEKGMLQDLGLVI